MRNIKAAFVGFGEINTPRDIIERLCGEARRRIEAENIDIIWTEPVSDDPQGKDAARAVADLSGKEFDLLIACVAGWIPSHAVISVIDHFKHKPILLWGLTGWMEGDRLVTTAAQAGTSALRKPMEDMGYIFKYVPAIRDAAPDIKKISDFAKAARAVSLLRGARIGNMGYRDMNLYATLHEGVSLRAQVGPEVECFEMLEIHQSMETLPEDEIERMIKQIKKRWTFVKPPLQETLRNTVKLYLAIKRKITERHYQAVSLIDVDGIKKLLKFAPAGVFMLIHDEDDICTTPENDTLGAVTQLMVRYVTGQVAAYLEFYEFLKNGVLMGVPDYVPSQIVEGPVTVMPTAFGNFGEGLLNVSKIKTGQVTIARLSYTGNHYSMHMAAGTAISPRQWEEAGWKPPAPQLPSLEIILDDPIEDFAQKALGQHYILSYGDNRSALTDLCRILKIEVL